MIKLEESFIHDFHCEQLEELPGGRRIRYYYPSGTTEGGHDGLIVQVSPDSGDSWIGIFAFGTLTQKGKSGLYSWPDPKSLCVVSNGRGYLVRADDPTKHDVIKVDPVLDVIPVAAKNLVVFANFTELVAYGEPGLEWESERLSWDGIKLTGVTGDWIEGKVWNPRIEAEVGFRVNLMSGEHEGGAWDP